MGGDYRHTRKRNHCGSSVGQSTRRRLLTRSEKKQTTAPTPRSAPPLKTRVPVWSRTRFTRCYRQPTPPDFDLSSVGRLSVSRLLPDAHICPCPGTAWKETPPTTVPGPTMKHGLPEEPGGDKRHLVTTASRRVPHGYLRQSPSHTVLSVSGCPPMGCRECASRVQGFKVFLNANPGSTRFVGKFELMNVQSLATTAVALRTPGFESRPSFASVFPAVEGVLDVAAACAACCPRRCDFSRFAPHSPFFMRHSPPSSPPSSPADLPRASTPRFPRRSLGRLPIGPDP